jgi:hypothetical protein
VAGFPTFEAELGYAVARGWTNLTLADVAILARYPDIDEAAQHAREVRKAADTWRHIADQLRLRIRELTTANARAGLPKNAIMAEAHEINRSRTLDEAEVTAIVEAAIATAEEPWQPIRRRKRRHA